MGYGDDQLSAGGRAPRGRRVSRVLGWVAVAVAAALVGGILTAYGVYRDVFAKIHEVLVTGLGNRPRAYNHALNILVIGSDTRMGKNSRFGARVTGQRSDTVLILHLSPGRRRAVVLSIPRDSVVPVLACPSVRGAPGQVAAPGQIEQINATYANGGPGCLWKTIEHTAHIRLDHFMEMNFTGFGNVINDLGGVSICLPYPIRDPQSKLYLSRGRHHVDGAQALAYWRVRYIGAGSDLERIQRDQYLMASVAQEVKHTDLLGNPARLFKIVRDGAASLTTDSGLSQGPLISLVRRLRTVPLRAVHFMQVPVVTYPPNPNWVQWSSDASRLFTAIAHDRKLPGTAARRGHRRSLTGVASRSTHTQPLSGVTQRYGGITAVANVCGDASAFAGPLGGH